MTDLIKAFGYLRVSGKAQVEGDGFPRQRERISTYASAHGITIIGWFEEKGVCGATDLDNRPALRELITALHSNGTKLVLIEKLDRLARDLMVQETIIADLRKSGFELVSVMEPDLCIDDPSRKMLRQFMGAIAEYDRVMITSKLRAARLRIRKTGARCEGRMPFGMKLVVEGKDKHVVPDEQAQAVIARMRELREAGENHMRISDILNQEGLKTGSGKQWYSASVARVLRRTEVGAVEEQ